ncbi:hypothetical protein L7F22_052456 [Adiantum nelumboides]|nr:hypothetical protein [Adiantum nelumboides]
MVARYQQQFKAILVDEIEKGQWDASRQSDEQRKMKFNVLFKRILDDAERRHSPIAQDILQKVQSRYAKCGVAKVYYMHDGQPKVSVMSNAAAAAGQSRLSNFLRAGWHYLRGNTSGDDGEGVHDYRRQLDACVDGKLANTVANIHVRSEDKSRHLDGEFFEKKLPELCGCFERMAKLEFEKMLMGLVKEVMK